MERKEERPDRNFEDESYWFHVTSFLIKFDTALPHFSIFLCVNKFVIN